MENADNIVIDQKDAAYYRNMYLNNCRMRINLAKRALMRVESINAIISDIKEQENKKSPTSEKHSDLINEITTKNQSMCSVVEEYIESLQKEFTDLQAHDFEDMVG